MLSPHEKKHPYADYQALILSVKQTGANLLNFSKSSLSL